MFNRNNGISSMDRLERKTHEPDLYSSILSFENDCEETYAELTGSRLLELGVAHTSDTSETGSRIASTSRSVDISVNISALLKVEALARKARILNRAIQNQGHLPLINFPKLRGASLAESEASQQTIPNKVKRAHSEAKRFRETHCHNSGQIALPFSLTENSQECHAKVSPIEWLFYTAVIAGFAYAYFGKEFSKNVSPTIITQ